MIRKRNKTWRQAAAAVALGLLAVAAIAEVRLEIPTEAEYGPVYVRPLWDGESDWTVWIFYRSPECIPEDFNLWRFFDFADRDGNGVPDPYDCELLMEGFGIWEDEAAAQTAAPIHNWLKEVDVVPIWFVNPDEVDEASSDGVLTIGELLELPSLMMGLADYYRETLHPSFVSGGAQVPMHNYRAQGIVEDGRSLRFLAAGSSAGHRRVFSLEFE